MTSQPNRSVLENPAWHAIASGQRNLAQVTADAGNYIDEVSVFGALREPLGGLSPLTSIVGKGRVVALAMPLKMQLPDAGADWRVAAQVPCHQMICEQPADWATVNSGAVEILPLDTTHVPQMLSLVKLTEPGPFARRTIEMGSYWGVFDGDQLVAMAGERMKPDGWVEVSGVCTHPDARGRGLAAMLVAKVLAGIAEAGDLAFLHVVVDGPSEKTAVAVYERLGFRQHQPMQVHILQRT